VAVFITLKANLCQPKCQCGGEQGNFLLKPMSEARGLTFAGLQDFFVGANVADANISAALLGCIAEDDFALEGGA